MSFFSLVVTGDRRLSAAHYRFLRGRLDHLLGNRLPKVQLLSGAGLALDKLAERWAEEHGLRVERFHGGRDYRNEAQFVQWVMNWDPSALVVFDGGQQESGELLRRARVRGVAVRIVDVRALVLTPH